MTLALLDRKLAGANFFLDLFHHTYCSAQQLNVIGPRISLICCEKQGGYNHYVKNWKPYTYIWRYHIVCYKLSLENNLLMGVYKDDPHIQVPTCKLKTKPMVSLTN